MSLDDHRQRNVLLNRIVEAVSDTWASFDHARPGQPGVESDTAAILSQSLPHQGLSMDKTLTQALSVLDQSISQSRPRFFAYIGSSGLEVGAAADFLASSHDINLAIDSGAANLLEAQTARWLGEFIGFHPAEGLFTSGGTISNTTALAAARQRALPNSREEGITTPVRIYGSVDTHYSNKRAIELLGFGSRSMTAIPIDSNRRMDPAALRQAIQTDLAHAITPVAVIASAGATLTGAVDPLDAIADVCDEFGVWMHVDGAYGVPAAATKQAGSLFAGLNRATSVTLDAHKWLFVPKACSIVLVKDPETLRNTFGHEEAYIPHSSTSSHPVDYTLEYSRPLRALKMWMAFVAHGADTLAEAVGDNIDLARLTYQIAAKSPDFATLPTPPDLSIVPLQYRPAGVDDYSAFTAELAARLVIDGRIYLSPATIDGETWLRPCFTNFRTSDDDVRAMFDVITDIGDALARSPGQNTKPLG